MKGIFKKACRSKPNEKQSHTKIKCRRLKKKITSDYVMNTIDEKSSIP